MMLFIKLGCIWLSSAKRIQLLRSYISSKR
jgi:hypothetical protein